MNQWQIFHNENYAQLILQIYPRGQAGSSLRRHNSFSNMPLAKFYAQEGRGCGHLLKVQDTLPTSLSEWLEPKTLLASRKSTCEVNSWYNFYFLRYFRWLSCLLEEFWNSHPRGMVIVDFVLNSRPQVAIKSVINGLIILTQGHVLSKIEKTMVLTAGWNIRFRVNRVLTLALINSVTADKSPDLAASHVLHL